MCFGFHKRELKVKDTLLDFALRSFPALKHPRRGCYGCDVLFWREVLANDIKDLVAVAR